MQQHENVLNIFCFLSFLTLSRPFFFLPFVKCKFYFLFFNIYMPIYYTVGVGGSLYTSSYFFVVVVVADPVYPFYTRTTFASKNQFKMHKNDHKQTEHEWILDQNVIIRWIFCNIFLRLGR